MGITKVNPPPKKKKILNYPSMQLYKDNLKLLSKLAISTIIQNNLKDRVSLHICHYKKII
jgi:hypothetical protein